MRSITICALLLFAAGAAAAEEAADAEILLLGTFHFANPGLDYVKGDVPDVLTEERQREIADLVERLKKFNPNKIAVEWPSDRQADLNQRYAGYRAGEHRAERNETYQIGFRLADLQALPAVHAIDVKGDMDVGAVMAWAQKNDPAFLRLFQTAMKDVIGPLMKMQKEAPIGKTLRMMNDPAFIERGNEFYFEMARVGDAANPVGAEQVGIWYARNIRIFANLARLARPGDRIVVVIGQGHVALLQYLIEGMPGMTVVGANGYL